MDDLTEEEREAVIVELRRYIEGDGYHYAPRLQPFHSALAKLTGTVSSPRPVERPPLPKAPMRSRGGNRGRR